MKCVCPFLLNVLCPGVREPKCPVHPNAPIKRLIIEKERHERGPRTIQR